MKIKRRIVIDTNILISASFTRRSVLHDAVETVLLHHLLLTSPETYAELEHTLLLPKFNRFVSLEKRQRFLLTFLFAARMIDVHTTITVCRDPKDNKFLELAVDGKADSIITGDKDLLALHPFGGIAIFTPRSFLDHLSSQTQ